MAMTAWSAKVSRRLICLSENGRTSVRRIKLRRAEPLYAAKVQPESVPEPCWIADASFATKRSFHLRGQIIT